MRNVALRVAHLAVWTEAVGIRGANNLGVSWPGVSHKSWKATAREKKKTLFLPLHVGFWSENLRDTKFEKLV